MSDKKYKKLTEAFSVTDDQYNNVFASILIGADYATGSSVPSCPTYCNPSAFRNFIDHMKAEPGDADNCAAVRDFIIAHDTDYQTFNKIDDKLSHLGLYNLLKTSVNQDIPLVLTPAKIAECIAKFCLDHKIWFDDSNTSVYEKAEIVKTTIGKALDEAGCYLSQPVSSATSTTAASTVKSTAPSTTSKTSTTTASTASTSCTKTAPKSNWKSRGPQSNNARGICTPGQKEFATGAYVYAIQDLSAKTKSGRAKRLFVNPIDAKGRASAGVNTVLYGSSNDYTDCTCYFFTPNDANTFLANAYRYKSQSLTVVRAYPNKNGYFKVKTDCGDCYIVAQRLNEDISTSITPEEVDKKIVDLRTRAAKVFEKMADPDLEEMSEMLDTAMHR